MISDNARNFEVTSKLLKKPMMNFNAENGVKWKFITECSPWMGGFWERMVQSVKKALKKSMDRTVVSTRALQVVLKEVEATLNRRPLTRHLTGDDSSKELEQSAFLCPASFLCGAETQLTP